MRKIVQLVNSDHGMVALCADGTLWLFNNIHDGIWLRIPDIPEDAEDVCPPKPTPPENVDWPQW